MDELIVNKTKYISSKRAHEITGYAKDYVGQLVRHGKLDAKRVGRAWYVNEEAIKALAGIVEPKAELQRAAQEIFKRQLPVVPQTLTSGLPKTWADVRYFNDDNELYPISAKRDVVKASEIANVYNKIDAAADVEKVKITVVRPQVAYVSARTAPIVSFSGVRTTPRTVVAKPLRRISAAPRQLITHDTGVVVGALLFLIVGLTFF